MGVEDCMVRVHGSEGRVVLAGRKLIGRKPINLIVGWCRRFLFFVVPCQFSQVIGHSQNGWPFVTVTYPYDSPQRPGLYSVL